MNTLSPMSATLHAVGRLSAWLQPLPQRLALLWRQAQAARRQRIRARREREALTHLSERDLHDLGLSRSDLPRLLRHHGVTHALPSGAGGDPRWF